MCACFIAVNQCHKSLSNDMLTAEKLSCMLRSEERLAITELEGHCCLQLETLE